MAHPSVPWQDEALAVATHKPNVYIDLSGWSPEVLPAALVRYANIAAARTRCCSARTSRCSPRTAGWRDFDDAAAQGRGQAQDPQGERRSACSGSVAEVRSKPRPDNRPGASTASATATTPSPSVTGGERKVLGRLREFLDTQARPLLADYWETRRVPGPARPAAGRLDLMEPAELTEPGCGQAPARGIYQGSGTSNSPARTPRWPRCYTAQAGLFRTAIRVGASAEQQAELDPGHRLLAQGRRSR